MTSIKFLAGKAIAEHYKRDHGIATDSDILLAHHLWEKGLLAADLPEHRKDDDSRRSQRPCHRAPGSSKLRRRRGTVTPEQAQDLLARVHHAGSNAPLDHPIFAEIEQQIIPMLETIAGMEWEYAPQVDEGRGWKYIGVTDGCVERLTYPQAEELWYPTKEEAQSMGQWSPGYPTRIVRRMVSKPEVME